MNSLDRRPIAFMGALHGSTAASVHMPQQDKEQIANASAPATQADEFATFALDALGCVTEWYRGAERTFGYSAKEVTGRHFALFFLAEDSQRGLPERNLRVAAQEGRTGVRVELARKDGSKFQANVIITTPRGDPQARGGFSILVLDVSALKSAQPAFYDAYEYLVRRLNERSANLEATVASLRASERRLVLALEAGEVGYWEWNLQTGQALHDERIPAMLGYAPGEVGQTRQAWEAMTHPDDLPRDKATWRKLGESAQLIESEHRMRCKAGEWRWMLTRGKVVERDAAGAPFKAAGTREDITDRKLLDLAHAEAEQRLRLAMEGAQLGFWDWEVAEDKFTWGGHAARILGIGNESLPGTLAEIKHIVHPDDRSAFREQFIGALKQGMAFKFELRLNPTDRDERWVHTSGQVKRDPAGRALRLTAVLQDVTARRLAERALLNSERRFRTFATAAPLGIFHTDAVGNLLFVNERWCKYAGVSASEAAGRLWSIALHPDDRARVLRELTLALEDGRELVTDCRFATPEGKTRLVTCRVTALRVASGELEGYIGTADDNGESIHQELASKG